jgi:hypothetical protein
MKVRFLLLAAVGFFLVAIGTDPRLGQGVNSACRPEGRIDGYLPSVELRPCRREIRSGATIHRGDRVTTTGQVTFSTQHVETCTLRRGSAVVYPRKWVVLSLVRGSIHCRQRTGRRRWKFRGRNVIVTVSGTIFGMTATPTALIVKVATGSVRVSARGVTRVVRANSQVTVPKGRRPRRVRRSTLTATDQEAFRSLRFDIATTHSSDAVRALVQSRRRSGAVIAENTAILGEIAARLQQSRIRLLLRTKDQFVQDPDSAADAMRALEVHVAVIAGDFDAMGGVLRVLRENRAVRDQVGRDLLLLYIPLRSVGFDDLSPRMVVTTQYASQGLTFGRGSDFGVPSPGLFDCGPPTVRGATSARSAPNTGAAPFCNRQTPNGGYDGTFGRFSHPVLAASAWVLVPTTCDGPCFFTVQLVGYDSDGTPITQRSVDVGPGMWRRISIEAAGGPTAWIRFFSIHRDRANERLLLFDNLAFEGPI